MAASLNTKQYGSAASGIQGRNCKKKKTADLRFSGFSDAKWPAFYITMIKLTFEKIGSQIFKGPDPRVLVKASKIFNKLLHNKA